MHSKRYRLLQNHPYAKPGTIVEEYERKPDLGRVEVIIPDIQIINIPLDVEKDWLEEVKEEPTCSREFAEAFVTFHNTHRDCMDSKLFKWIQDHTSTEEKYDE